MGVLMLRANAPDVWKLPYRADSSKLEHVKRHETSLISGALVVLKAGFSGLQKVGTWM